MGLMLFTGGARSGKSALARQIAERQSEPVFFIATATEVDREMAERISRHRAERPGAWHTIEEPLELANAIAAVDPSACLIVDCLSIWVANAIQASSSEEVRGKARRAAEAASSRSGLTLAVTNEVGSGIVPVSALARAYRDLLGEVNALWAAAAEDAYLAVAGRALPLRSAAELLGDGHR